ncbi:GDP-mannose transporter into the lumen of the Golgi [Sporothrix eucalyptigena]|uniref:GDP-mannose transporter n=1 Tax=Sporothrix eucalyptigena TaxID=1812306 RepID=A0ABP0BV45_9PEZI
MAFTDKKNEDYVVRMDDLTPGRPNPLRSFNAGSPAVSRGSKSAIDLSRIENSPGFSILSYCLASISMTVVNKFLVSGSYWNMNFLYLALQSITCVVTIQIAVGLRLIPKLVTFSAKNCRTFFPVAALLVGMIYTGAQALKYMTVPVYTIFKNLTIIVIAYGEVLWFGGKVPSLTLASFGLMVISSIVAAWADIRDTISSTHPSEATDTISTLNIGYAWMIANVICSATFVLGMRKLIKKLEFKDRDTMFYNNFMSIPILVVCSLLTEDWSAENLARNFPVESRNNQLLGIFYSGIMAVGISYCSAWCVRVTSSTTYSMVGALNKLPIAVSGLIFFDTPITVGSVGSIALGSVAGVVYTIAKLRQQKNEQDAKNQLPLSGPILSSSSQSSKDANNA